MIAHGCDQLRKDGLMGTATMNAGKCVCGYCHDEVAQVYWEIDFYSFN